MIVKEIQVPYEWESSNDWDSHRPLLWLSLKNMPDYSLLELGSGYGSTPLLKNFLGSRFMSFDNNPYWCEKTNSRFTSDLLSLDVTGCRDGLGIVFIDCAPGEIRKDLIKKWDVTPVIIVHDTEVGAEYVYGMSEILSTFKYRLDYQPEGKPHTTAVSNFIDVTKWITQD